MARSQLQNSIERWLFHENYTFNESKTDENAFHFIIKGSGADKIPIEIFEPKKQPGVIVLGGKIFLQNRHTARFLKLNEEEQEKFKNSVKDFCDSIKVVHRVFREDGKVVVGVYVVLDKVEQFTQQVVLDAINQVLEMSEKTSRFIMKTF
ncbi:MAG: DUF2299 family protein [Nitrososphaerota archaeon]